MQDDGVDVITENGIRFYSGDRLASIGARAETRNVTSELTGISYNVSKFVYVNPGNGARFDFIEVFYVPSVAEPNTAGKLYYILAGDLDNFKNTVMQNMRMPFMVFPNDLNNNVKTTNWYNSLVDQNNDALSFKIVLPQSCFEIINTFEEAAARGFKKFTMITSQHIGRLVGAPDPVTKVAPLLPIIVTRNSQAFVGQILNKNDPELIKSLYLNLYQNIQDMEGVKYDYYSENSKYAGFMESNMLTEVNIVAKGIESKVYSQTTCPNLIGKFMQSYNPTPLVPTFAAPAIGNFAPAPVYEQSGPQEENLLLEKEKVELSDEIKQRIENFLKERYSAIQMATKIIQPQTKQQLMNPVYFFNVSTNTKNKGESILSITLGRVIPDNPFVLRLGMRPQEMKEILGESQDNTTKKDYVKLPRVIAVFQIIGKKIALELSKIKAPDELPLVDVPLEILMSAKASTSYQKVEDVEDEEAVLFEMSNYSRFPVDPSLKPKSFGGKKNNLIPLSPLEAQEQIKTYKYLLNQNTQAYPSPKPYQPTGPLIKEISNFESVDGQENWKELDMSKIPKSALVNKRPPRRDVALLSRRVAVDSSEATVIETGQGYVNEEEDEESISGDDE